MEVGGARCKLISFLTYCILKDVEGDSSAPEAQKPCPEGEPTDIAYLLGGRTDTSRDLWATLEEMRWG